MLLLDVMPRIRQEEDFRASAVFNDDPKWTTGNASEDLFTSHKAELKGNNDLLTLTKVRGTSARRLQRPLLYVTAK